MLFYLLIIVCEFLIGFIKYVSDSRFIDGYSKVCCTLCKFGPVHKEHAEFYSVSGPAGPTWLVQLLSKVTVRIFLDKKQLHPIIGTGCQNTKAATGDLLIFTVSHG